MPALDVHDKSRAATHADRTDQVKAASRRQRLMEELSWPQLVATVSASVLGVSAASYLGVLGTIIGAAVISVVATVGTTLLKHSLERTDDVVREVIVRVPTQTAMHKTKNEEKESILTRTLVDTHGDTPETEEKTSRDDVPRQERTSWSRRRLYALVCVGVFVVTLGVVTAVELIAGKPLSTLLWGDSTEGTSISRVFDNGGRTPAAPRTPPSTPQPVQEVEPPPPPISFL